MEKRTYSIVFHIASYIKAIGGVLQIKAVFPKANTN